MNKHTPAPWQGRSRNNCHWVEAHDGKSLVADVAEIEDLPLITAAPRLLAALECVLNTVRLPEETHNVVVTAVGLARGEGKL